MPPWKPYFRFYRIETALSYQWEVHLLTLELEKQEQRSWNPQTLKRLKEHGLDLSKPQKIFHNFYIYSYDRVDSLIRELEAKGFHIEEQGKCVIEKNTEFWAVKSFIVTDLLLDKLNSLTNLCIDLAAQNNGIYDGWHCEL